MRGTHIKIEPSKNARGELEKFPKTGRRSIRLINRAKIILELDEGVYSRPYDPAKPVVAWMKNHTNCFAKSGGRSRQSRMRRQSIETFFLSDYVSNSSFNNFIVFFSPKRKNGGGGFIEQYRSR